MASPITSWEGAEVYFTYADSPFVLGVSLLLAVAIVIGAVMATFRHEEHSFASVNAESDSG